MTRFALVTAAAARGLDEDLPPLELALKSRSINYSVVDWDDAQVDWTAFDLAILRSTWDYTSRVREFLSSVQRISQQTRLANPFEVIAWNTDKHYLRDLAARGCATVRSCFVEPGESGLGRLRVFLAQNEAAEFVVKPAIGAGSKDTQRYRRTELRRAADHIRRLSAAGRSVVLQPYLGSVDREGETALIYFRGNFSHAIRKGPLLRLDQDATRALFAPEHITPRTPAEDELNCARGALEVMPFSELLYARVDLIRDANDAPRVLEVELTEPSLFFDQAPDSAGRMADAAVAHLAKLAGTEL